MPAPAEVSQEHRKLQARPLILDNKSFCRREFESDPGQMFRCFRYRIELLACCGIMHDDPFSGDGFQNHEVAHVPVKDSRELELAQMLQLVPEGPSDKMKMARDLDQGAKRDTV